MVNPDTGSFYSLESITAAPILVTGAAGGLGGVGSTIVASLRQRGLPVRALVHREDERAEALRATGAEVVMGDLTQPKDVARASAGCRRLYFGMSVSKSYLEATVIAAAVAREQGDLEVFVNISQMTVSQMSLTDMTESHQQRFHFLAEQVLNWSGLPLVHLRATVFLQTPFSWRGPLSQSPETTRYGCPSGLAAPRRLTRRDVGEVAAAILESPSAHVGKVYELTGPRSQDMPGLAEEYSEALGRTITYIDVPFAEWRDQELRSRNLPDHVFKHLTTMARLHAENRYDRLTHDVEKIIGRPATSARDFVARHATVFQPNRTSTKQTGK